MDRRPGRIGRVAGGVFPGGRGAGEGPTASAVVADLIDIARGAGAPVLGIPAADLAEIPAAPMAAHVGAYSVRLPVPDRPRVIAARPAPCPRHSGKTKMSSRYRLERPE